MSKALITKEFFTKAARVYNDYTDNYEIKLHERITYIINTIVNLWGNKLDSWYFDGAIEDNVGNIWDHIHHDMISGIVILDRRIYDPKIKQEENIHDYYIIYNDKPFSLQFEFPIKWLYEDFESELIDGKTKYEAKLTKS